MCRLRLSLIEDEILVMYGTFFIIGCIVATFVNLVALYILWLPGQRTKSTKILTSLVASDIFTGIVVFPLNAYQSLGENAIFDCTLDFIRAFFALLMTGSSVLTLVLVAFDRYILMTRLSTYESVINNKFIIAAITFCWLYPGLTPALKYAGKYPYLISMILIFYGPIILLIILYVLLINVIYNSRKKVLAHSEDKSQYSKSICTTASTVCSSTEQPSTLMVKNGPQSTNEKFKEKRSEKRHLKIAKSVAVLLGCYLFCMTPFNIWLLLDISNGNSAYISAYRLQHVYLFGVFIGAVNSCINPFIYLSKQPGFRKRFRAAARKVTRVDASVAPQK